MKISAQEEYGLRCLLQLARAEGNGVVPVAQIAEAEGLSVPYAEKLLRILHRAGLVGSVRGSKGGYRLAVPSYDVTLGAALRALGNLPTPDTVCGQYVGRLAACVHKPSCSVRPVWAQITSYLNAMLDGIVLADLLEEEREVRTKVAQAHSATVSASLPPIRLPALRTNLEPRSYKE